MAKIKKYQIEATIAALEKELNENQIKLSGFISLKNEGVIMLMYRDENGDSYPTTIDERISALDETIATIKTHLDLFKELIETQYC